MTGAPAGRGKDLAERGGEPGPGIAGAG